jgi:hypothetical protein
MGISFVHGTCFVASACERIPAPKPKESIMKTLLSLVVIGLFSACLVGCHGSVDIDPHENANGKTVKTTTVDHNGNSTVQKETKTY